jgi:U3 small nucleolar RNA-associated protein 12
MICPQWSLCQLKAAPVCLFSDEPEQAVVSEKVSSLDMYGHPTGIRSIALSSDDDLACTVSKNEMKIWNVTTRSCIQSLSPSETAAYKKKSSSCYGLCAIFLPGNTHVILGTREGHLFLIDIASGDVVFREENAHDGAIWSIDVRRPTAEQQIITVVTGSADKTIKFWDVEAQDEDDEEDEEGTAGHPMVVHTRTLQMADDVVAVRYSHSTDPTRRLVFASKLDSTIKVFFDDTLKFFLSLYGHKLPALAVDASDDDTILASSGADKTVKIWGLDFGDTHRTLHGHEDSVTDLRFVKRTHNFFTTSKDGTLRYWDGDRFEQILLLTGHSAEVSCLAVSRTGAFVLSGGMDRQVRVWERTKDIVFLEEERERELERMFDADGAKGEEQATASIMRRKDEDVMGSDDEEDANTGLPQSEAAVKRSMLNISAGDRIIECLERADEETKEIASCRRSQAGLDKQRMPNPLLLGLEPPLYMLWVLRSVKSAELEQSLLVLPLGHMERLLYYLIILLKNGRGVELCSRVAVFLVKIHENQVRLAQNSP